MKNLAQPSAQQEIRSRIAALRPQDQRRWGTLTVEEMMAHVRQAYVLTSSGKDAPPIKGPLPQGVMRFFALDLPVRWPKGIATVPILRREAMPPAESFADELQRLEQSLETFVGVLENTARHAIFGAMRPADWMRWGYLHADHHLRQFGR